MPISQRESVSITSVIESLLYSYPIESCFLGEILRNSDGAGARKQIFVLDTRYHPTRSLFDPVLLDCQGPALICMNNTIFQDTDWDSILEVPEPFTGKDQITSRTHGPGFRSCYHITDNPHILSGDYLLILDPHHFISGEFAGGVRLSLDESRLFADHFAAYSAVMPLIQAESEATAIRLPLRLPGLATKSEIKKTPTTVENMRHMLRDFVNKNLTQTFLSFTSIEHIEILEVDGTGSIKAIAKAWKSEGAENTDRRINVEIHY